MKKLLVLAGVCALALNLSARDDVQHFSIEEALNSPKAKEVLNPNIKSGLMANKKTNAFNKSDKEACEWAFLSAVKTFQERAVQEGGSRVVNLTGYYKKQPFDSKTQFQCGAGALMAGVTLKGDIAK